MERLTGHHEVEELLGAYALDAVDPDEAAEIEYHLSTCPRCRAELAEHREVAALLGYAGAPAPAGVWDRIVAGLEEPPPALRLSPTPPELVSGPSTGQPGLRRIISLRTRGDQRPAALAPVVPIERRKKTVPSRMFVAAATAAAVIIAGLGVEIGRLEVRKSPTLNPQAIQSLVYQYADANPGARRITLTSADSAKRVPAVVLPDGTSVLGKGDLATLPNNETYQLWGIVGAQQVSLRVVGNSPDYVTFTTPPSVSVLAMTVEQQGGVIASTKRPVVSGLVPTTA